MNSEIKKIQILCINVFLIFLKATTLNPGKLEADLKEMDYELQRNGHFVLGIFLSIYLVIKFIMGYITLGANIIAVFPILTDDLPNLLLPAILVQSMDHIALNFIEIILGLCTFQLAAVNMSVFLVFLLSKLMKIVFAITALNVYSDYYLKLQFKPPQLKLAQSQISQETLIRSQPLR